MDSTKHLSVTMIEEFSLMPTSNTRVSGIAAPCTVLPACKHMLVHVQRGWIKTVGAQMLTWELNGAQVFVSPRDFCFISSLLSFLQCYPIHLAAKFHPQWCPSTSWLSHSSSKAGQVTLWGDRLKGQMCLTSRSGCWHPNKEAEEGIWAGSSAWKEQGPSRGPGGWKAPRERQAP